MNARRLFVLVIAMFLLQLPIWSKKTPYGQSIEKTALTNAIKILKVYYPSDDLCVSDSIYDLEWLYFKHLAKDKDEREFLDSYRMRKEFRWDKPIYSRRIGNIATSLDCMCNIDSKKYVADFSRPYHNMIRCDIMPIDRQIGIYGAPTIPIFFFRYDETGVIIQFERRVLCID